MAERRSSSIGDTLVSLPQWIESEDTKQITSSVKILRKTTVAYGISELLRHSRAYPRAAQPTLIPVAGRLCDPHNFTIRTSPGSAGHDIVGVDMLSPRLSAKILEPPFLCSGDGDQGDGLAGRYLEVECTAHPENGDGAVSSIAVFSQSEEDARCHALGRLLYELFSPRSRRNVDAAQDHAPPGKKMRQFCPTSNDMSLIVNHANEQLQTQRDELQTTTPLLDLGIPASISLLVQNLIECGDDHRPENAYESLEGAIQDLHLVLLDPTRFLFHQAPPPEYGVVPLSFRSHKLYGREKEVSLITEAFCRVSCGKSEAFFVEGFSGSGKSRLVNSLTARIDVADGYVITHKFDSISKENQLLEVISMFNDLCLLVCKKRTQSEIEKISIKLMDAFGSDLSLLAQMLPNVQTFFPQMDLAAKEVGDQTNTSNLQSICFLLRRFMTVVSSSETPVMVFWDDLQWSELPSLTVAEEMLTAAPGSCCLFFVGSYRNDEIPDEHALFPFMRRLTSSGVPTNKLRLEGLPPKDINQLLSDALCMFPRVVEPLSDILYQKTLGNPFFIQRLISDIADNKLLEYSFSKRCWVWDEDKIGFMDITDNVLDLLSSKMGTLSQDAQLALKVASCLKTTDCLLSCLGATSLYANILAPDVERVVFGEGYLVRDGTSGWKWVHDKIREAAYSLIPDNEKNQFHFHIGIAIYSVTKGTTRIEDIVFDVVDQINRGLNEVQSPELRCDLAELNEMAGTKAAKCSDYVASRSYFDIALSLLPLNHWESHYDRSLRLYFLSALSDYSSGDGTKAVATLRRIICQARCLQDKLKSYYRLIIILFDSERIEESYTTACDILSRLGEEIPDWIGDKERKGLLTVTSKMLSCTTEEYFQHAHTPPTLDTITISVLEFYNILALVSFSSKPQMTAVFIHRMVQLSINHGVSIYSLAAIMHYAAMISYTSREPADVQEACRIAKRGMKAFQQLNLCTELGYGVYLLYYCFVAPMTEPLQLCADNLRRGFESGIARGDRSYAFMSAVHVIRLAFFAGTELPTLLKNCEYYLEVMNKYSNGCAKNYLALFRETILTIIGETGDSDIQEEVLNTHPAEERNYNRDYHKAIRCFWLGRSERCHYFAEKVVAEGSHPRHNRFIMHYYGLNSLKMIKKNKKTTLAVKVVPKKSLRELKDSFAISRWSFRNKVHLLEAEIVSYEENNDEAKASYVAAIESAQCSNFIHEQGLAWELFGVHYTKIDDHENARNAFQRAKLCYSQWGSKVKVGSINHQIELLEIASKKS